MNTTSIPSPSSSPASSSNTPIHHYGQQSLQLRRQSRPPTDSALQSPPSLSPRKSAEEDMAEIGENEQSPLLPPRISDDGKIPKLQEPGAISEDGAATHAWTDNDMAELQDTSTKLKAVSWWFLFRLTACFFGLQMAWSFEQSQGSPFLTDDLQLSKGVMSLVWIAGPLSGVLVQPYVGMKSDRCRSRFGKRRPFMLGGAIATIVSILILVWSFEIVGALLSIFGLPQESNATRLTSTTLAIVMLYVLDFSINVLQASARTFIVDSAPSHLQDAANAWAGRFLGIGDIVGFTFGYLNLHNFYFLGDNQMKQLAAIASALLAITVAFTVFTVPERDGRLSDAPRDKQNLLSFFKDIWHCVRKLPRQIKIVCYVQMAAWVGWFPALFYTSLWIQQLYKAQVLEHSPDSAGQDLNEEGKRKGSFALLLKAIVTISCSIVIPWIVRRVSWLTLKRAWVASHFMFALLGLATFLIKDVATGTMVIACLGVPWAITMWVPFALIAIETKEDDGGDAGAILGIHNMAIAFPQVIAILVNAVAFSALEKDSSKGTDPGTIAWAFRFGGMTALLAAVIAMRLREDRV